MIRNRDRKFESRKLTLEQRIARLERAIAGNRSSRRRVNEGLDMGFGNRVKAAVERYLGGFDYYTVAVELKSGALFVDVQDEEAMNGYEYGIAGYFRIDEDPAGYMVSVADGNDEIEYELGTARDVKDIADLITNEIGNYVQDL